MKKITLICYSFLLSITSFSQTCEERETKLLTTLGGVSAGFLYCSYISIGAVADGYVKEVYTKEIALSLLDDQKKLLENVGKLLKELVDEKKLKSADDSSFVNECNAVITGLRKQAVLFVEFIDTKKPEKATEYDTYRKNNWNKIAKLMGIGDSDNN